jgi:hypothetical protein
MVVLFAGLLGHYNVFPSQKSILIFPLFLRRFTSKVIKIIILFITTVGTERGIVV